MRGVEARKNLRACLENSSRRGNEAENGAIFAENPPRYLGGYIGWPNFKTRSKAKLTDVVLSDAASTRQPLARWTLPRQSSQKAHR